jgi:hypothetical protein
MLGPFIKGNPSPWFLVSVFAGEKRPRRRPMMSLFNEHNDYSAYDGDEVVQWLMIAAIVMSGVAVTAIWLYLQW